jgi:hypothetical protein
LYLPLFWKSKELVHVLASDMFISETYSQVLVINKTKKKGIPKKRKKIPDKTENVAGSV